MDHPKIVYDAITFDDVLLIPAASDFTPAEADTHTRLTRGIELNIPFVSAPMDTVTEAALAIALAQEGGIGVIHKNLSAENQAREVEKVKRSENGAVPARESDGGLEWRRSAEPAKRTDGDPTWHASKASVFRITACCGT